MSGKRNASLPRFPLRPSRRVSALGVVAVVAAGALSLEAVGTASADTLDTVMLTVDGVGVSVSTAASDVGDLLAEQQVTVDDTDELSPGRWAAVTDGMTVTVDHVARVTVVDDDTTSEHLVSADTAAETSVELDLPQPEFASLATAGAFEPFRYRRTVLFAPDGSRLRGDDTVADGSQALVQDVRIGFRETTRLREHRVARRQTVLLPSGVTRVVQQGRDGKRELTWRRKFVEGVLADRRIVDRVWAVEPRRRLVKVGTGPNWYGLARCESGGNPDAVNPAGFYGLYQFSLSTWRGVGGTGYPTDHGYWEQTYRAWKLYQQSGRSPWPHCGVYL